jgi:hypothetical protein
MQPAASVRKWEGSSKTLKKDVVLGMLRRYLAIQSIHALVSSALGRFSVVDESRKMGRLDMQDVG